MEDCVIKHALVTKGVCRASAATRMAQARGLWGSQKPRGGTEQCLWSQLCPVVTNFTARVDLNWGTVLIYPSWNIFLVPVLGMQFARTLVYYYWVRKRQCLCLQDWFFIIKAFFVYKYTINMVCNILKIPWKKQKKETFHAQAQIRELNQLCFLNFSARRDR